MSSEIEAVLAETFARGLSDWQLRNLVRHRDVRYCCGADAWHFFVEPDIYAPEVLANCPVRPVIQTPVTEPLDAWCETFRHLCAVSGVIRSSYAASRDGVIEAPLTRYSMAMEGADQDEVQRAIRAARRIRGL